MYMENIMSSQLEDDSCPICLEETYTQPIWLECAHKFCKNCIYKYMMYNKICPVCLNPTNLLSHLHPTHIKLLLDENIQ